jgi:hypothetical protein
MPTVQKRTTSATRTANRRRDRNREEDSDVTAASDDDDVDENDSDYVDEDDETEDAPESRAKPARTRRSRTDDNGDDDEKSSRKNRRTSRQPATTGIRFGWDGAEETLKAGGSGDWLNPDKTIQLIKFLQDVPLLSCRQHWLDTEGNAGQTVRRPYVCPGVGCPICALGDSPGPLYAFNVLHLSGSEQPRVKLLRLTTTGYQNLREVSADKKTGSPVIDRDFYAVQKTGAGTNSARVVFRPVKERDLDDDWDEVYDHFDPDDLEDIIAEAQENLFPEDVIKPTPMRELEKLARYLNDKED